MFKAVIFDLDGTLIDTEKYYRIAWPEAFAHFGYKMTDEQYLYIRSLGKPFVQEVLKGFSGDNNFDYDKVIPYRKMLIDKLVSENGIQIKKGAFELLDFLRQKNVLRAVATASPVERAERYLNQCNLLPYFDRIISARDMKEGKPSPDVYLYVLKELGMKASDCLAVEDSPNGVLSASRAGLNVVMVPDLTPPDEETSRLLYSRQDDLGGIISLFQLQQS